jgi:Protein of unknown function (DUF3617)
MRLTPCFPMRCVSAMLVALASHPLAASAALPMHPGLWELRVATTIARVEQPAMTSRECLSQKDIDQQTKVLPRPDGDCTLSNVVTNGNRTAYDMVCKLDRLTARGRMELVTGSENYDGMTDMKFSGIGSEDIPVTVMVNAKRLGDCEKK